jgi:hypothetical protein
VKTLFELRDKTTGDTVELVRDRERLLLSIGIDGEGIRTAVILDAPLVALRLAEALDAEFKPGAQLPARAELGAARARKGR